MEALKIDIEYSKFGLPVSELMHCFRVAKIAYRIGVQLELTEVELIDLYKVAIFHDIGKARVDKMILGKKGRLSQNERKHIELHPIYSEEYLKEVDELKHLGHIVRAHHERWDGSGYPDNLKKRKIPLLARIISIADVYDALTNDRVYRRAKFTDKRAKEIMLENSGKQFEPNLLEVFFEYEL